MTTDLAPAPVDGRAARGARTRESVVRALLALHEEGDLAPTVARVAERAGVALRTVYGHFADAESLFAEAGERELQALGRIGEPVDPALPLPDRVARFAHRRALVLERLLPVYRASRLRQPFSRAIRSTRDRYVAASDEEVDGVFADRFAVLPADRRTRLRHAVYAVACAAAWDVLRDDRGLDPAQAEVVLRCTLASLLAPGGDP